MQIQKDGYPVPVSPRLINILATEIDNAAVSTEQGIVINFRDKNYSPETGGFHPVEIAVNPDGRIRYINDFSYVPPMMDELAKELDFDFVEGIFQQFHICFPIAIARKIFRVWQRNFCEYWSMCIYDEVQVQEGP